MVMCDVLRSCALKFILLLDVRVAACINFSTDGYKQFSKLCKTKILNLKAPLTKVRFILTVLIGTMYIDKSRKWVRKSMIYN